MSNKQFGKAENFDKFWEKDNLRSHCLKYYAYSYLKINETI